MNTVVSIGRSFPLGATIAEAGADLSPFSRSTMGVELLFFDDESDARPSRVIRADPPGNSTYHYWHVFGPGVHLDELAAAAVYSKGTLCLHFKTKEDLVLAVATRALQHRADLLERATPFSGNTLRKVELIKQTHLHYAPIN